MLVTDVLLIVVAMLLFGLLTAVKSGFNQVIRGFEALDQGAAVKEEGARSPVE